MKRCANATRPPSLSTKYKNTRLARRSPLADLKSGYPVYFLRVECAESKARAGESFRGGRAVRYELHPLVYPGVLDFSLPDALNRGLLPRHYPSPHSHRLMESYVGDYLREEIAAEALTRNIPAFGRFLEVAAMTNGDLVNYANIASECGVSAPSVKEYFQILEDTLIGKMLPACRKRAKRRIIAAPKFYFLDLGIVAHLTRRGKVLRGGELFGKAFEHFIWMELSAHSRYTEKNYPISYWKTSSGHRSRLYPGGSRGGG